MEGREKYVRMGAVNSIQPVASLGDDITCTITKIDVSDQNGYFTIWDGTPHDHQVQVGSEFNLMVYFTSSSGASGSYSIAITGVMLGVTPNGIGVKSYDTGGQNTDNILVAPLGSFLGTGKWVMPNTDVTIVRITAWKSPNNVVTAKPPESGW